MSEVLVKARELVAAASPGGDPIDQEVLATVAVNCFIKNLEALEGVLAKAGDAGGMIPHLTAQDIRAEVRAALDLVAKELGEGG